MTQIEFAQTSRMHRHNMFGITFIKVAPTPDLLRYRAGKVVREGLGHPLFHFAPATWVVAARAKWRASRAPYAALPEDLK